MSKKKSVRNFGIAAHIDAGKTTTSERILKFTGEIHKIGEVHDGAATMDYMEQEKSRGITIQSASTQCEWKFLNPNTNKYEITTLNFIDTPGHIDFTIEVERALRVLDGVILLLEGVGGVQSQTLKIWHQRSQYKLSTIIFINKMDRMGADFNKVLESINRKLDNKIEINGKIIEQKYIILNIPVGTENNFSGVIDIIEQKYYYWKENQTNFSTLDIPETEIKIAKMYYQQLLENLASFSEEILQMIFEEKEVPKSLIYEVLREGVVKKFFVVILCGSSFKNKGVQQLLDAVCNYFPSPNEINVLSGVDLNKEKIERKPILEEKFSGFVFKNLQNPSLGELSLTRLFSGKLKSGDIILNANTNKTEKIGRIYVIKVNQYSLIEEAEAGDIIALQGLKNISNGDTLCDKNAPIIYDQMIYPVPVISQKIVPFEKKDEEKLGKALNKLAKEDPSFKVNFDEETKETIISGMGSLHLEIKITLLKDDYGINLTVYPPTINYRETPIQSGKKIFEFKKQSGGAGQYALIEIILTMYKDFSEEEKKQYDISMNFFESEIVGTCINKQFIPSIEKGIMDSLRTAGPLGRYPVQGCKFTLINGKQHCVDSNSHAFYSCAVLCTREILKELGTKILEPIMKVSIFTPNEYIGKILGDLSARDGIINETNDSNNSTTIEADIPLRQMMNYIDTLRTISRGEASYTMIFSHYSELPDYAVSEIVKSREKVFYR